MTPIELTTKFVETGKTSEKTAMLIDSLPDEKCAILAYDAERCKHFEEQVKLMRPEYNVDNVTFLVYTPNSGWRDKLLFRDMDVFLDHEVIDMNSVYLTKAINDVYGKAAK